MNETYKTEIKRLLNAIHDEDSLCKIYTLALVRANHEASRKQEGGRTGMSEAEMREEIQKMLAEADRATLSEVRVFLQYYLGVQGQNGGNV